MDTVVPKASGTIAIDLTGIEQVPVGVRALPHGDASILARDALGLFDGGGSPAQRAAIRHVLRRSAPGGLGMILRTRGRMWEGLTPTTPASRRAYDDFDNIDRDRETFRSATEYEHGGRVPAFWRPALTRPGQFFDSYVRDCDAVWRQFRARLGDVQPIFERETERIATAVVRGTLPELLVGLLPHARLRGSHVMVHRTRLGRDLVVAPDGLSIGPMLHGLRGGSYVTRLGTNEVTSIWYPAPGLRHLLQNRRPDPPSTPDSLVALLGHPRTDVLRHLDRPTSVNALAELLRTGPSGVTYHVDALVAAGLVTRHRQGRFVLISRTARGDQLLDLYTD